MKKSTGKKAKIIDSKKEHKPKNPPTNFDEFVSRIVRVKPKKNEK